MGTVVKLRDRGNVWRCRSDQRALVHIEHLCTNDFDQGFGDDRLGGAWFGEACASAYDQLVDETNGRVENSFHMKGGACERAHTHAGTQHNRMLSSCD